MDPSFTGPALISMDRVWSNCITYYVEIDHLDLGFIGPDYYMCMLACSACRDVVFDATEVVCLQCQCSFESRNAVLIGVRPPQIR